MAAAVAPGTPAPAPVAAPKPAAVAEAPKPVEAKEKPETEAKEDSEGKTVHRAGKAPDRETTIAKFARKMNADAEKDGVQVDAPPAERRQKPGPKPGSKREPKAEAAPEASAAPAPKPAAQANPKQPEAEADDDAGEPDAAVDDDADTGKPEPRSSHQLKAKARLRHGDVDKAIRLAFGDLRPEEFETTKEALAKKLGVGSKQWADFRRYEATERAKSKQLEANATQLSQRLQAEFTPMIEARKAYAAKDYPRAFELAFGEEINSFQRKALHQHLSADPEATRTKQELAELKAEIARLKQPPQADPAQEQRAALQREAERTHHQLTSQTDDPEIAFFASKPAFVRRVVELRGEHYDPQTRTTIPLQVAADMAREELRRGQDEWRYQPASGAATPSSELPGQAGNEPVRTSHRARSPIPSQAAQAGGSTRSMTTAERIKLFAARMG